MADGIGVTILVNDLPRIAAEIRPKAEVVVAKIARDMEAGAKRRAPVDTGLLRASITARRVRELTWTLEVGAEYGAYVEYGTRHMAAQPYLHPAYEEQRPRFLRAMEAVVPG